MKAIRLLPLLFCSMLLAAHFYRAGSTALVLISLAIPTLLIIRHILTTRLVQLWLLLGSLEWLRTLYFLVHERQQLGHPYIRLAVILVIVALCTGLSALPLSSKIKEKQEAFTE